MIDTKQRLNLSTGSIDIISASLQWYISVYTGKQGYIDKMKLFCETYPFLCIIPLIAPLCILVISIWACHLSIKSLHLQFENKVLCYFLSAYLTVCLPSHLVVIKPTKTRRTVHCFHNLLPQQRFMHSAMAFLLCIMLLFLFELVMKRWEIKEGVDRL